MLIILEQNLDVILNRKHIFHVGVVVLTRLFLLPKEFEDINKSSILIMNSKTIKVYF